MREFAVALLIGVLLWALNVLTAWDPTAIMVFGQRWMTFALVVALPLELLYFTSLARMLSRHDAPPGWYWRSFEHHERLAPAERRWVLPWFWLATLGMLCAMLGGAVVLIGGLAAWRQS